MHALGLDVLAQHHAGRQLDEVYVQRFRDERDRPRRSHVALDDLDRPHGAGHALLGEELHVEWAGYLQGLTHLGRHVHHPPVGLHAQALGGQEQGGVAAVGASILDVLGDRVVDQVPLVAHGVELDLPRPGDVLGNHNRVLLLDHRGGVQEALELRLVVDDTHGGPRQDVRGPHQDREAHRAREGERVLELHELAPFRLVDVQLVAHGRELRAIFRGINGPGGRSHDLNPALVELRREVVRRLPADRDDHPGGHLEIADLAHRLKRQLLEIQAVALVVIGGDGLWVAIDHHCAVACFAQGAHRTHGAPVELHRSADPVAARAEDDEG
mmetsp:Transcript_39184/g.118391  ORF Transcript_39184/g.118391 Transcript_39184/m.118391 type:complete len:327 (-) Transcript_39184:3231-4211(-)